MSVGFSLFRVPCTVPCCKAAVAVLGACLIAADFEYMKIGIQVSYSFIIGINEATILFSPNLLLYNTNNNNNTYNNIKWIDFHLRFHNSAISYDSMLSTPLTCANDFVSIDFRIFFYLTVYG